MQKLVLGLAMAALLAGCATPPTVAVNTTTGAALQGKSIVHTRRTAPGFSVLRPMHVLLGPLGGALAVSAGNNLITNHRVADPAVAISAALLKEIATRRSMDVLEPGMPADSSDPARISAIARGQVNYVLDVETGYWNMVYFPTHWNHYRLMYSANARLIDASSGRIVAQSTCKHSPESKADALSYEQLVGSDAAGLKKVLQNATDACIAQFKANMLSL